MAHSQSALEWSKKQTTLMEKEEEREGRQNVVKPGMRQWRQSLKN